MLKAGLALFVGILLGRCLGLVREVTVATEVGVNLHADVIIALMTLPDLLIKILIGNAFAAVFIPKIKTIPTSQKFGYFLKLSLIYFVSFSILAGIGALFSPLLAEAILPARSNLPIFIHELNYVLLAIPFLALNMVSRSFLQSESRFKLLGMESVIFNTCIIIGVLLFARNADFHIISLAVITGAFLRWIGQAIEVYLIYDKNLSGFANTLNRTDLNKYVFAFSTGVMVQALPFICRSIVSYFEGTGGLSMFNYTFKFIEFPMALGFYMLSTVSFPVFAQIIINNEWANLHLTLHKCLNFVLALALPVSLLTLPFALAFSNKVPSLHNLSSANLGSILIAVGIGCVALVFRGINELTTVLYNSLHDVRRPMIHTTVSSCVALILAIPAAKTLGLNGCFIALDVGYIILFLLNALRLRRMHKVDIFEQMTAPTHGSFLILLTGLAVVTYFSSQLFNFKFGLIFFIFEIACSSVFFLFRTNGMEFFVIAKNS